MADDVKGTIVRLLDNLGNCDSVDTIDVDGQYQIVNCYEGVGSRWFEWDDERYEDVDALADVMASLSGDWQIIDGD